jgi:hypothetical protein
VAIIQISRIQHRRGKATDLPQLAAGELGWVIDEQRLYIGNGTVADGAPAVGNTEILTSGSASFSAALNYVYQGYLGDATPILTGATTDITRTLQERLDDYVSVRAFGAVGDDSTADAAAIQRAIDELYSDTDQDDTRSRRILFFPAGTYRIASTLTIPPYAHLVGEGPDKTIIRQSGAGGPVAVTEDDDGNTYGSIGTASATTPTQITIEGITFKNMEAYAGFSVDCATHVRFVNCKFQGTYTSGGADASTSKGVTVRSTTALPCSNIIFDSCQFTKFARLVDFSYDLTSAKFINCDFSTAYYGVIVGEQLDGSTSGLTIGPKDVKILSSQFSTIRTNGIFVKASGAGADAGVGEVRNVVSFNNFFASTVGDNGEGVNSIRVYPAIQFDADECVSELDYFDNTQRRSSALNPIPEVQGIGVNTKQIRQITLSDNTGSATTTGIRLPALEGKSIKIEYKIERGTTFRVGTLTVNASGSYVSHNDDYEESNGDVGVTLSAVGDNLDSTAGNETVIIKYTTTSTGTAATMDHQVTEMV